MSDLACRNHPRADPATGSMGYQQKRKLPLNTRDVVGLMDLGETNPYLIHPLLLREALPDQITPMICIPQLSVIQANRNPALVISNLQAWAYAGAGF